MLGKIASASVIFLWCAGMVLPNLDSHTRAHPVVKAIIAIVYSMFLIGTPIALATYFNRAWRRVATVPNRTSYVIWMSVESIAAGGLLGILAYATASFAIARFR
jgi:Mg2+/citrate symporter